MENNIPIQRSYHSLFIIYFIVNFLIVLGITIFILFLFLKPYLLQGNNVNDYFNDYCNNKTNRHYDLLCTNTYFNYKKSKFIWITIDGMATDQLVELHNFEKYKITTSFLNMGKYNKYTNMLYESMMTGKYNKNLVGAKIRFDNFIKQIINAKYKVSFTGWKVPIAGLAGDDLANMFYKKTIDDAHEILVFNSFCNMTNLFPFLQVDFENYQKTEPNKIIEKNLENKIIDLIDKVRDNDYYLLKNVSKNILFEKLDEIFSEVPNILLDLNITECLVKNFDWKEEDNISIIYYSTEVDESNHFYGKNHIYTLLQTYLAEKMVINLMKWIDEHNDYALIINSDHGGQHFYGEDTIRNHGEDFPGNEGIFYIYTKDFKNNYDKLKINERYINIIDESVLMTEILENVNIPLESKGIPYQLINDEKFAYSSLKRKEIQLINLIHAYDNNKNFQTILQELNYSFELIDGIKEKYFKNNNIDDVNLMKELKEINKKNLEKLIDQQNIINEIIRKDRPKKANIAIAVVLIIILIIKAWFEFFYIFKSLKETIFNSYSRSQKIFTISFIIIYLFIIEFIFLFLSDSTRKLEFFVQLFLIITCIILIIMKIYISYQPLSNFKLENKIYYYFLIIFGYLFFHIYSEYSYVLNSVKSFFSRYNPQLILNIIFLYPLLILFSFHEIKKCNFQNKNKKGEYAFKYIIIINIIFIIVIFIEDMSYKTYYYQNTLNLISMYFALFIFIIYFISCFVINSLNLTNDNHIQTNISKIIDLNSNINQNFVIKKASENIDNETIHENKENINSNDLIKENNTNSNLDDKNINILNYYYINNFIFIKLCIVQGIFWLSEETEKIYLFLSLLFFELSESMTNYLYINIFGPKSDKNDPEALTIKKNNLSLLSFIFYIIIKKIEINMNQIFFLMIVHSYDINSARQQQEKFIRISSGLGVLISYISNFKFAFLIAAYYLEKNYLVKKDTKNYINFPLFFILKRIIINLNLNNSVILLIYQALIEMKDEQLWDFATYYLEDFILFFFDYLLVGISLLAFKIFN